MVAGLAQAAQKSQHCLKRGGRSVQKTAWQRRFTEPARPYAIGRALYSIEGKIICIVGSRDTTLSIYQIWANFNIIIGMGGAA